MYNLFVSANPETWEGKPWIVEIGRCIREYTDNEITKQFGDFKPGQIDQIRRFPCIFAYETFCDKNPKFGLVSDVISRQGKVKVEYNIIALEKFITHDDMLELMFELDISDWELNRTHWAIKNVNLGKELALKGVKLPRWARNESKSVDITMHKFDVSFSFPGEIRDYVESIAVELERAIGPNSYFYDNNYKAQLARPSLDTLLQELYRNRSRLVVVFLCHKYQEKEWCGVEYRAIREIIKEKGNERVMFVKMDEGKVDGVFSTDGYIDGSSHTPQEIAEFIQDRLALLP